MVGLSVGDVLAGQLDRDLLVTGTDCDRYRGSTGIYPGTPQGGLDEDEDSSENADCIKVYSVYGAP